jgi:hypothetical protein
MFSLLLLSAFSQLNEQPTDCEICKNVVDYGYLAYIIYGRDYQKGEAAMNTWCHISYPDALEQCQAIAVAHYPELAEAYADGYPRVLICPDCGYCPKPTKAAIARAARPVIQPLEPTEADHLFTYLKAAKTEIEVERLLETAPASLSAQARLIPTQDVNLVLQLLQRNAKSTFVSYLRERAQ